jgi:tetratricopeptide (TPR) repeat protein
MNKVAKVVLITFVILLGLGYAVFYYHFFYDRVVTPEEFLTQVQEQEAINNHILDSMFEIGVTEDTRLHPYFSLYGKANCDSQKLAVEMQKLGLALVSKSDSTEFSYYLFRGKAMTFQEGEMDFLTSDIISACFFMDVKLAKWDLRYPASVPILNQKTLEYYNESGQYFFNSEQYWPAARHFEIVLTKDSLNTEVLFSHAHAMAIIGDTTQSLRDIAIALQVDPKNINTLLLKASFLAAQGEIDSARVCYMNVLQVDSGDDLAHIGLGQIYFEAEDTLRACSHWKEAAKSDSELAKSLITQFCE